MIKFKSREKVLLYGVVIIVLFFLVDKFFLAGLRLKAKGINQKIKLQEANLKMGTDIQNRKEKIFTDSKNYKVYLEEVEGMPDREIVAKFLREIETISQESGVAIVNLNPQNQPEDLKEYKRYKVDMRAEANPEQLANLLYKVQSSRLLIKFDKLSLTPKDEEASVLRVEASVSIAMPAS